MTNTEFIMLVWQLHDEYSNKNDRFTRRAVNTDDIIPGCYSQEELVEMNYNNGYLHALETIKDWLKQTK